MITNLSNNYCQNPYFGMLDMTSYGKNKKALGKKLADSAEHARPVLEELGKDYDIYIRPKPVNSVGLKGFHICVKPLKTSEPDTEPVKKTIIRIWNSIIKSFSNTTDSRPYVEDGIYNIHTWKGPMSDLLVKRTKELIDKLEEFED